MFGLPRMPTLDLQDGARLHVEAAGHGPALLALHGWSRSGADLASLLARLPGLRTLALDLRGHGRSAAGPLDLDLLAGDLAATAEALSVERAVLLGWSLGGQVALAALARHPALRRRLAGLALLSSTPRFTASDDWPHGLPPRSLAGLAAKVRRRPLEAFPGFFDGCFAEGELDEAARSRLAPLREAPAPDLACAQAGLRLLGTADLRGELAALAGAALPVLVVHGEGDPICPPGAGRALAAAFPGARLVTLPGAGHAPFLTRETEVAAALRAFAEAVA